MRSMSVILSAPLLVGAATLPAQVRTLDVGDATINYDVSGRGRAVVFIHGWAHNLSAWDDQVPVFKSRYQVVRYDSRGFGHSTGFSDVSLEPRDLLILLEALHVDRAFIVGHSRGGNVALRFAAAYPERVEGLVLYGSAPGAPEDSEAARFFASLPDVAKSVGLDSVGKLVLASPLAWVPPGRTDVTERYHRIWAAYSGKDLLDPRPPTRFVRQPSIPEVYRLKVPILLIMGDHEAPALAARADTLVRHMTNARKVVIPNAGHGAHFAQPTSFNSALMDFFFDVERNRKR